MAETLSKNYWSAARTLDYLSLWKDPNVSASLYEKPEIWSKIFKDRIGKDPAAKTTSIQLDDSERKWRAEHNRLHVRSPESDS